MTDPRLDFPAWATGAVDRAMFYVMTARRLDLPVDFDTLPEDVARVLFPPVLYEVVENPKPLTDGEDD